MALEPIHKGGERTSEEGKNFVGRAKAKSAQVGGSTWGPQRVYKVGKAITVVLEGVGPHSRTLTEKRHALNSV